GGRRTLSGRSERSGALEIGYPRSAGLVDMANPEARREDDPVYMGRHGPRRRAYNAAYQPRSIADLHRNFHAPEQALHQRRNGAEGLPGAGVVSAIVGMARREWGWASLSVHLQQQLPGAPSRQSHAPTGSG